MGILIQIDGKDFFADTYTVSEDATPTATDDSSGGVGTLSFNIPAQENAFLLVGKDVSLLDTHRGTTVGYVDSVSESDESGMIAVNCISRLGRLNIYGIQAQPFHGTLENAFRYYLGLANQVIDVAVDSDISGRPVIFPGWEGELWFNLKQMAAAQGCEVALVSNVIFLRPLRKMEAIQHRDLSRSRSYGGGTLAQSVEVYCYQNRVISDAPVYPPGGWNSEVRVITANAGETVEEILELSSSLSSIQQPVMQTFVSKDYSASSVFTAVGDDGLPIQPAQWTASGGSLTVFINPDTTSLTVRVTAPTGITNAKGQAISTYSIALGSDFTSNRYSTLRLVGTGVAFDKELIRVGTGVSPSLTATEVGITIDNPFLSTWNDAYTAAARAARNFAGEQLTLSGTVASLNQLGDSGSAAYPKYSADQAAWSGRTYAQVQTANTGKTYAAILEGYYLEVRDDFENQVFGNTGGSRIWDQKTHRWYRTRSGSIGPGEIGVGNAEDDLQHFDVENTYSPLTYAQERDIFQGMTYSERFRLGLWPGETADVIQDQAYPSTGTFPGPGLFPIAS